MTSENRYLHLVRQDCPVPQGTHVVIYCRDSGGESQDRSVQQQEETAREYCNYHGLIVDNVYLDEAKLSSNTNSREALQDMLYDLRRNRKRINDRYKREKFSQANPYSVIFWKSNRLGRDSIEATNIKTDLRMRGITLIDLVTSANTGNAAIDALIEAFQQWQDEQLLDEISQNARRGLAQIVGTRDNDPEFLKYNPDWKSTGAYLGVLPGGVPMGFKAERIQIGVYHRKRGRSSGEARIVQRIVPDPDLWDRCRLAWEMRLNRATYGEIHEVTGLFKNKNGYTSFFGNRIYTGDLEYGDKLYENFVPALITKEEFEEEQKRRAERYQKLKGSRMDPMEEPVRKAHNYLLSGLVYCGHNEGEEHAMHIESIPAKKGKRGNYTFYICSTKKNSRSKKCSSKRLSLKALDQSVIDLLMTQVLTRANLRPIADNLAKSLLDRNRDVDIRLLRVESELSEVKKAMDNILDAIENMGYAPHLQKRYDERKEEETKLLNEKNRLKRLRVKPAQIDRVSDAQIDAWLDHTRTALEDGNSTVARQTLQQFVAKIVIKDGAGTLFYTFPFEEGVDTPSVRQVDLRVA